MSEKNGNRNAVPKQLTPFVKGDPRINRKGRPRTFDQTRKLAQAIAHEEIETAGGKKFTVAEAILRQWARSKVPTLQQAFIHYAFGKVPDKVEHEGEAMGTIVILRHAHEEFEPSRS